MEGGERGGGTLGLIDGGEDLEDGVLRSLDELAVRAGLRWGTRGRKWFLCAGCDTGKKTLY